ncbi:hypothetical protein DL93DRAFT_2069292, partial [Clavulina sp. PMI_390]
MDNVNPGEDPRCQRPIDPNSEAFSEEWPSDVKRCGEFLQRHPSPCKPVCFKYGSKTCRFQFPHEIVEESGFDGTKKSILLRARDPTINWYNPIILTSCRHNHDLKFILSGRSAKGAMFYISDYITKNDEQKYDLMSL